VKVLRFFLGLGVVLLLPLACFSQVSSCKFPDPVPYCIFPAKKTLRSVCGVVSDAEKVRIPDSCVTLFDKKQRPIASVKTDENGRFYFGSLPSGNYVMVVDYVGFTPAMARIDIRKKHGAARRLFVMMTFAGIDTCSIIKN
jgi:hypothetical protein